MVVLFAAAFVLEEQGSQPDRNDRPAAQTA
jgi:hypothetical protein